MLLDFRAAVHGFELCLIARRRTVGCKTCQASVTQLNRETAASAFERHYRAAPACRPVADATPTTIVNLVLDLSDRIPYRGVINTDPRLWEGFAVRATKVKTFSDACGELYWLSNQARLAHYEH